LDNSSIDVCELNSVNVQCYKPRTCKSIQYNNNTFPDKEFKNKAKLCSIDEDIVDSNNNISENNNNFSIVVIGLIILGGIVIILTVVLIAYKLLMKNRTKKTQEISIVRSTEELLTKNDEKKSNEKVPNKLEKEFLFQNILND